MALSPRSAGRRLLAALAALLLAVSAGCAAPEAGQVQTPQGTPAPGHEAHEGGAVGSGGVIGDGSLPTGPGPQGDPQAMGHDMRQMFPTVDEIYERLDVGGLSVEFTVKSMDYFFGPTSVTDEGMAAVKFRLTETVSGAPVTSVVPRAWIDRQSALPAGLDPQAACEQRVAGYLKGGLTDRPAVDLNSFFILALNDDATVSVIDPMVNLAGITQLYAMLNLPGPAADWALSADQQRLFITAPAQGAVVAADTGSFRVVKEIAIGGTPGAVAFQPDEARIWVGDDGPDGGVLLIDPATLEVAGRVATGAGPHTIAFRSDSRYAFVTNGGAGTLSVVDAATLAVVAEVPVGEQPVAVDAYGVPVYVAAADGTITVVDVQTFAVLKSIATAPGLATLRLSPDGRWAFAPNPLRDEVVVIDTLAGAVAHTLPVAGRPDQVSFGGGRALFHLAGKTQVAAVSLTDLDSAAKPPVTSLPYGEQGPAQPSATTRAAAVAAAERDRSLLVSSPSDGLIYYFPEGATAPAGSFKGYGRAPRAVRVVDRGFREETPGVLSASFRVPESGDFVVAMLLEEPRAVHCFNFSARPAAVTAPEATVRPPELELLSAATGLPAGQEVALRFALNDAVSGARLPARPSLVALVVQQSGGWSQRYAAAPQPDGSLEVRLTLPSAGRYSVYFSDRDGGLGADDLPQLTLEAGG